MGGCQALGNGKGRPPPHGHRDAHSGRRCLVKTRRRGPASRQPHSWLGQRTATCCPPACADPRVPSSRARTPFPGGSPGGPGAWAVAFRTQTRGWRRTAKAWVLSACGLGTEDTVGAAPDPEGAWGTGPGAGPLDAPEERLPHRLRDRPPDHWRESPRGLSGSTSPHPRGSPGQPGHARPRGQRLLRAVERSRLRSSPSVPSPGQSRWPSRHSGRRPCPRAWAGLGWEAQPARGSPASPAAQPSARPGPCPLSEHPEALESRAGLLLWGVGPEATSPPAWARLGLICPEPWNAALILPASPARTHAARPGTQPSPSRSPTARGPRACTRCWSRVHKPRPLGRGQQDERALGTSPAHRAEKL